MPALGLAAGIVADYASETWVRADLQQTADTAALAGVNALALSEGQPEPTRIQSAIVTTESLVTRKTPEAQRSITPSLKDLTVSVRLSRGHQPAFRSLFGKDASPIAVTAVASYVAPSRPTDPRGHDGEPSGYDRDPVGSIEESNAGRPSAGPFGLDRQPRPETDARPQFARRGQPALIP